MPKKFKRVPIILINCTLESDRLSKANFLRRSVSMRRFATDSGLITDAFKLRAKTGEVVAEFDFIVVSRHNIAKFRTSFWFAYFGVCYYAEQYGETGKIRVRKVSRLKPMPAADLPCVMYLKNL